KFVLTKLLVGIVAAGQIGRPAPIVPGGPSVHTGMPLPAPPPGMGQLFPLLREETPLTEPKPLEEPVPGKPLNMGTVEYNENLQAPSTQPGLSVVNALNQALIKGPRAAAIRAQFAAAWANIPAATQAPNPLFFLDRGLVAEQ